MTAVPELVADIALVTEARYQAPGQSDRGAPIASGEREAPPGYVANIFEEDRLLAAALSRHGLSAIRVDWARADIDWSAFRCAVLRTPWDYPERMAEFTAWIDRVAAATRLVNSRELVHWNLDKHYLADLAARGVGVVPTRYVEPGTEPSLARLCDQAGWEEIVVKPAQGAAARDTYRIHRSEVAAHQDRFTALVADRCMMVQEFQRDIVARGEVTLVVLGGRYSHAVLKVAGPGDFRVQDDYGGTLHDYRPSRAEIDFAEQAVAACSTPPPVYGRVDFVRLAAAAPSVSRSSGSRARATAGELAVMELELVEPELWFRRHPPAAAALADQLAELLLG